MKQNKMYEAPKVELITMEMQGILCSSVPAPETMGFGGNTGVMLEVDGGTW
jgi:hypothetical protein